MNTLLTRFLAFSGEDSTVFAIVGLGLFLRLIVLALFAHLPLISDALSYHKMAVQLLNHENFLPYWPPGLPYFLACFYFVFGVSEFVGRVSMLLFYVIFSAGLFCWPENYLRPEPPT